MKRKAEEEKLVKELAEKKREEERIANELIAAQEK